MGTTHQIPETPQLCIMQNNCGALEAQNSTQIISPHERWFQGKICRVQSLWPTHCRNLTTLYHYSVKFRKMIPRNYSRLVLQELYSRPVNVRIHWNCSHQSATHTAQQEIITPIRLNLPKIQGEGTMHQWDGYSFASPTPIHHRRSTGGWGYPLLWYSGWHNHDPWTQKNCLYSGEGNKKTAKAVPKLLNYDASNSDEIVHFHKSDMQVLAHSDASYIS